ncbi:MAG: hypothetical protein DMF37_10105 [Verrucomicrobia bacterium]|nr:MAG: hypothetical protein DMF37_10105 [Verrucomicrobiota bacterium]
MCNGLELVKTPAKEVTGTSGQREINQSQHSQVLDLPPASAFARAFGLADISANRKRSIFFVKHLGIIPQKRTSETPETLEADNFATAGFGRSKGIATWRLR